MRFSARSRLRFGCRRRIGMQTVPESRTAAAAIKGTISKTWACPRARVCWLSTIAVCGGQEWQRELAVRCQIRWCRSVWCVVCDQLQRQFRENREVWQFISKKSARTQMSLLTYLPVLKWSDGVQCHRQTRYHCYGLRNLCVEWGWKRT